MTTRSNSTGHRIVHARAARLGAVVTGFTALLAMLALDVPAASARAVIRVPYGRAVPFKVVGGGHGTDMLVVAAILAMTALLIGALAWAIAVDRRVRPSGRSEARSRARSAELARGRQTHAR